MKQEDHKTVDCPTFIENTMYLKCWCYKHESIYRQMDHMEHWPLDQGVVCHVSFALKVINQNWWKNKSKAQSKHVTQTNKESELLLPWSLLSCILSHDIQLLLVWWPNDSHDINWRSWTPVVFRHLLHKFHTICLPSFRWTPQAVATAPSLSLALRCLQCSKPLETHPKTSCNIPLPFGKVKKTWTIIIDLFSFVGLWMICVSIPCSIWENANSKGFQLEPIQHAQNYCLLKNMIPNVKRVAHVKFTNSFDCFAVVCCSFGLVCMITCESPGCWSRSNWPRPGGEMCRWHRQLSTADFQRKAVCCHAKDNHQPASHQPPLVAIDAVLRKSLLLLCFEGSQGNRKCHSQEYPQKLTSVQVQQCFVLTP